MPPQSPNQECLSEELIDAIRSSKTKPLSQDETDRLLKDHENYLQEEIIVWERANLALEKEIAEQARAIGPTDQAAASTELTTAPLILELQPKVDALKKRNGELQEKMFELALQLRKIEEAQKQEKEDELREHSDNEKFQALLRERARLAANSAARPTLLNFSSHFLAQRPKLASHGEPVLLEQAGSTLLQN